MSETIKDILSPKEAAAAISMSPDFVYDAMHDGRLQHSKMGRVYRIRRDDLIRAFPSLFRDRHNRN